MGKNMIFQQQGIILMEEKIGTLLQIFLIDFVLAVGQATNSGREHITHNS